MPQMGVSVAEGTRRRVEEAGRRLGRGRRGDLRDLDRQDRHRRGGARDRAGCRRSSCRSARRSRSAPCWRGSRPTRGRASRTSSESSSHEGTSEADVARRGRRRGRRAAGRHGRRARERRPPRRARPSAAPAARRYSPVVMRMAAEHDLDLAQIEGTGRGGRVRKQDVLAFLERTAAARRPSRRCTSSRPTSPTRRRAPKKRAPRFERRAGAGRAAATLSRMRQSIGRAMVESLQTAATCTTIVEADMTRVDAARRKRSACRSCRSSRARRSRRCASSRRSTRRSRARPTRATTPCTSASRSRSATTA